MSSFNLDKCKYDFSSDNINIIANIYDVSGSMSDDVYAMRKANEAFYEDFSRFEERGSIAIAKGSFNAAFGMTSFGSVKNFDKSYSVGGGTALYYAIVQAARNTIDYYNEITKRLNIRPRITFLVFSDGEDNESANRYYSEAIELLKELNSLEATTVFVAFGKAKNSGIGERLGFSCIKNIENAKELISCMGTELSRSCKEQSRSAYSLKSEFFSKADQNAVEDVAENQAIFDDDFFVSVIN